jgi:hypothetical protein
MVAGGIHLGLGETLASLGRLAEAERELRTALRIRERALGPRSALPGFTKGYLAAVLMRQRRFGEAESELLEGLAIADQIGIMPQHPDYQRLLRTAAGLYDALGRPRTRRATGNG